MKSEHKNLVRLYLAQNSFSAGARCELSDPQAHYLRNVMRLSPGASLRVFNGRDGEWIATVGELGRKKAFLSLAEKIKEQQTSPAIRILASPVKREAYEWMVEKAAELGAAVFQPVICARTVVHRINTERLQAISIEASEQCERLDIMTVEPPVDLRQLLQSWDAEDKLVFCRERGEAKPLMRLLPDLKPPLSLLVGPEGGFTDEEAEMISGQPFAESVSLGSSILRAETALVSALACVRMGLSI